MITYFLGHRPRRTKHRPCSQILGFAWDTPWTRIFMIIILCLNTSQVKLSILHVMTRLFWHVEHAASAFTGSSQRDEGVTHTECEVEVREYGPQCVGVVQIDRHKCTYQVLEFQIPGQAGLQALITMPSQWQADDKVCWHACKGCPQPAEVGTCCCQVKQIGVVLGHPANAHEWRGTFMSQLARHLAMKGCFAVSVLLL